MKLDITVTQQTQSDVLLSYPGKILLYPRHILMCSQISYVKQAALLISVLSHTSEIFPQWYYTCIPMQHWLIRLIKCDN